MRYSIFLGFLCIFFVSCSEDDTNNFNRQIAYVIGVDAPETAKVGEITGMEVTFTMYNTCGQFSKFVESTGEQGKIIEVLAIYPGKTCGHAFIEDTRTFEFLPEESGVYQFNFSSMENEFITVNIEVVE